MIKVILQFAKMVTDILLEEKMGKDIVEEQRVKNSLVLTYLVLKPNRSEVLHKCVNSHQM